MPTNGAPWPRRRSPPASTPPVGVPDGFSYRLTVDGTTVYFSDPRLTEEQRKLISKVLKEGA